MPADKIGDACSWTGINIELFVKFITFPGENNGFVDNLSLDMLMLCVNKPANSSQIHQSQPVPTNQYGIGFVDYKHSK